MLFYQQLLTLHHIQENIFKKKRTKNVERFSDKDKFFPQSRAEKQKIKN